MSISQDLRRLPQALPETAAVGCEGAANGDRCGEATWEAALGAMRTLEVGSLLERALETGIDGEAPPGRTRTRAERGGCG